MSAFYARLDESDETNVLFSCETGRERKALSRTYLIWSEATIALRRCSKHFNASSFVRQSVCPSRNVRIYYYSSRQVTHVRASPIYREQRLDLCDNPLAMSRTKSDSDLRARVQCFK